MAEIGLNVPGDGSMRAADIRVTGADWVRFVLYPHINISDWLAECRRVGILRLGVLARESFDGFPSWQAAIESYRTTYGGLISAWQVGNEEDHASDSSWTMDASAFTDLCRTARSVLPAAYLVGGGLVSGQPQYLDKVDLSPLSAISVHGYGQRPEDNDEWGALPGNFGFIGNLIGAYKRFNLPIWMTEIGVSTTQVSEAFQARYASAMMGWCRANKDIGPAFWFCATDAMVPKFGLLRANGSAKPALAAYSEGAVLKPLPPDPPAPPVPPTPPTPSYYVGPGVQKALDEHGWSARSPEGYFNQDASVTLAQTPDGFRLVYYWATTGKVYASSVEEIS